MTEQLSPGDAEQEQDDGTGPVLDSARHTAESRPTEEHGAVGDDDSLARFRRPPPGKPVLLPEEPPRTLDDTPVAEFAPIEVDWLEDTQNPGDVGAPAGRFLAWDEAQLFEWAKRAVMTAAFALPVVIIFGLFGLVIALTDDDDPASNVEQATAQPNGTAAVEVTPEASPVLAADWTTGINYPLHTVPALIKDEIATLGAQMGYRFTGEAGTAWAITVEPRADGTLNPQVTLYAPSGTLLATNDDRSPGITSADINLTLPESGEYRVLVESSEAAPTIGSYLLALFEQ